MMYSPPLAAALQAVAYANDRLDRVMQELTKKDVEKVMQDNGYFDRYITATFSRKSSVVIGNQIKYIYAVTFHDGDVTTEGRVFIWWDGTKIYGDY